MLIWIQERVLGELSLENFKLWSTNALKSFLRLRKKSNEGTFEELVARYRAAALSVTAEHTEKLDSRLALYIYIIYLHCRQIKDSTSPVGNNFYLVASGS